MKRKPSIVNDDKGSVMVAALMVLVLLTIIGISASNISVTEVQIATNSLRYERAFYTAEAGLEHAKQSLKKPFVDNNKANVVNAATATWNFAIEDATATNFAGGDVLMSTTLDGVSYTVTIWDDNDGGAPPEKKDTNGLVYISSEARGPRGALCRIETLLDGNSSAIAITGNYAQEGSEAGKGYTSQDLEKITDFSDQLGSP
jgi:hypothetical protein